MMLYHFNLAAQDGEKRDSATVSAWVLFFKAPDTLSMLPVEEGAHHISKHHGPIS